MEIKVDISQAIIVKFVNDARVGLANGQLVTLGVGQVDQDLPAVDTQQLVEMTARGLRLVYTERLSAISFGILCLSRQKLQNLKNTTASYLATTYPLSNPIPI